MALFERTQSDDFGFHFGSTGLPISIDLFNGFPDFKNTSQTDTASVDFR